METLNRNNATKSPAKTTKNLVEHVEHYKAVKADHVPANIVKTLNLASSKVNKSGKAPLKTVKVPVADGKEATHAIVPRPDNAWNYPKQRSTLRHLTKNTPCFCGAGRDISFLYDAKVIDNRAKPLTSLSKSREGKHDKMGEVGMKTPGIEDEYDWAAESLIPEEYHVVRVSGVHGLNIEDAPNTTLTEEHEHHVTLFPSLKPTSRKEVMQLMETMDHLLEEAGCTTDQITQVETTEVHNLLQLIKKEQHIYNVVFHELIRQVTVGCKDRGVLLAKVREYYQKLLDRIPRQIMSLHQEVMAQRALDRRLTDELIRFKTAIATLSKELNEVREHDQEVTQQALEAQKDLASALSESEKNANLVAEYHSLYEIQRSRLEFQITTLNKERDLWSRAVYDLAVKICQERNLRTARRLQLCEQAWNKLAGHFGLVLADVDSKALQDLQNSVDHWRGRISSFSRELERIDDSMKDQLEKILGEVDGWRDDLAIRIRPTGRVEIPPDYPVEKLFQNCRMWEEMLSVLIERFSGDTLLASQEDLTKISRLVDVWKDAAINIFSHHPRKDSKRHPCQESLLLVDKECEELMQQFVVRVSGENASGVARGIIGLVNPIETWGNRLMAVIKGEDLLSEAEWAKLSSNLQEWSHVIGKVLSRLTTCVVISEEDDITTIPPSIMEDFVYADSVYSDDDRTTMYSSTPEPEALTLERVLGDVDKWLRNTSNTIDNENAVIVETVSVLHNDMIRWMVMMILELTAADSTISDAIIGDDDDSDLHDREPIGGTYAKLSNFETAGKAVCSKLREFTAKIIKCCNDIVLEIVANKQKETECNSGDNEYKDLKRLETECEEWIKTANMLIQEAGGESDLLPAETSSILGGPSSILPAGTTASGDTASPSNQLSGGVEHVSQETISTEDKPHITEVEGEKNLFVLGEDENIQSSTMDEILSRHSTDSASSEKAGLNDLPSREAGKTGNPLSDAETHVNLVNELNKQVQDTVTRAKTAEEKVAELELELSNTKGRVVDLEKELEEEKTKVLAAAAATPASKPASRATKKQAQKRH
ncbi:axonemal dynein light chain domain-containing protein 1-like isoform X4 [Bolinopsis microptera]|uniref:axonemal dynein light chain domain-containing protein 1-like isoform X4 n=1 Tax=Bolinopsis microptera TaxID=2820187 RepID=UPI003079B737